MHTYLVIIPFESTKKIDYTPTFTKKKKTQQIHKMYVKPREI